MSTALHQPPSIATAQITQASEPSTANSAQANLRKQHVSASDAEAYVHHLARAVKAAVAEIVEVNASARTLALNARIEAARAGVHGAAFGVVATEIQQLSARTTHVADSLANTTRTQIDELLALIGNNLRGTRLSDLARTNIDLIDRNLYERTCDVRWWATDSSLTQALTTKATADLEYASRRLGIILDAYTVYYDLLLCDIHGNVVANGRPNKYSSVGRNAGHSEWFQAAMRTNSGNEYGFQSAHLCDHVNGDSSLVYSCTVRENGDAHAPVLGVLGVVFNWSSLAVPILRDVPLAPDEKSHTTRIIVDQAGTILASADGCAAPTKLRLADLERIKFEEQGYFVGAYQGKESRIAHAKAPGFESYSTGWYSLIIQPL
jgi:hypothetical protein